MTSLHLRRRFLVVAGLAFYLPVALLAAADAPFLPLPPKDLLALLPKAPTGWTVKVSKAQNQYVTWLTTTATREFEGPPIQDEKEQPLPPPVLSLKLVDTGRRPGSQSAFPDLKPGANPGVIMIHGFPALRRGTESAPQLIINIQSRFVLTARLSHGSLAQLQQLLGIVDLARIARVSPGTEAKVPNPVQLISINELAPEKSRTAPLYWTDPDALVTPEE